MNSDISSEDNKNISILIAEDSPTQAERLKYILKRHGYRISSAANGRMAFEAAMLERPTLVISDILMPEMSGYELCQKIKSEPTLKNVPVILVTTLSDPQDVIRGLECRADNFIIKPYDERYLLSRIQFVLLNNEMHEHDQARMGVEIYFNGKRHLITADRLQILNLLLSTYEAAIERNYELSRTKDELRAANAALEATNKELEAFSYSVSHDLRAPLRAIDGFSQSLSADYSDRLDDDGQDLLNRVHKACHRMGQLIDDLLNLSRLGRAEMHRDKVDLSGLATVICDDLQKGHPDRQVSVEVASGLTADGDARLLRIALENLLANAWKFTARQPQPRIEVGMNPEGGERVFFVRDNGAGFDMAYASKLFGPFQRLHSTDEFPGTGIGLATVQRIVRRHGGRIWALSAVGEGAAFYFTL